MLETGTFTATAIGRPWQSQPSYPGRSAPTPPVTVIN